jgi:hypothetical protein
LSFIAAIFADVSFTTVCLVSITDPPLLILERAFCLSV